LAFLTQNKAELCKILSITLVFEKNANFFAENCQKSQKIVIITSTPACCSKIFLKSKLESFQKWFGEVKQPEMFYAQGDETRLLEKSTKM
jgi:hypothetical protein